jgi:hypothetical protein
MIYLIPTAFHLLVCLALFFGIHSGIIKVQKYMFIIALLLPFWGALIILILHFEWGFTANDTADISTDKLSLEAEFYKSIPIDEKRSDKTVPIEEALLINSAREKRTIIMDILNENPRDYIAFLQKAGNNDDTEVVHYAVTAMVEISKENDYTLQQLSLEYTANPYDLDVLTRYCDFLWACLTQNLMQGQVEVMNRELFSKLVKEKLAIQETLEDYTRLVRNELKCKNIEQAGEALEKMKKDWSETEEYILLNIQYLAFMNKGKEIRKFIRKVNSSQIFLSTQTKEVLAFWAN